MEQNKYNNNSKIALVLSGFIGSIAGKQDRSKPIVNQEETIVKLCNNHWKNYLFDICPNVDVFIHTWSHDKENLIHKYFKPKKIILEKPITYSKFMNDLVSKIKKNNVKTDNVPNIRLHQMVGIERAYNVYNEYINETNEKYDIVMFSRMDMCLTKSIPFNIFKENMIYRMHAPHHDGSKHGYIECPIICTSSVAAKNFGSPVEYYTDISKSREVIKPPNGLSMHKFTYHIMRVLSEKHNVNNDVIPDFKYVNHYHTSAVIFCRHLYFSHLDIHSTNYKGPQIKDKNKNKLFRLPENIKVIKSLDQKLYSIPPNYYKIG